MITNTSTLIFVSTRNKPENLTAGEGKRGARINCISAGIVFTPLAYDELNSPERGAFYRDMLAKSPAGRGGTADEIAALAEFLFGPNGTYVTGSDLLIDGGATAAYKYGELRPQ
nr:SDR family oxidoreductase [Raoultella sp. RIT712]